jgi:hypothetical protein
MPLVRTMRRRVRWPTDRRTNVVLILLAGCLLLSGCSSGAASDAKRDEARDASLKDQLAAEQATWTAQHYFPPTSTPGTPKPMTPSLGALAVTFGFRSDGTPDGSYASVPAGAGTAYIAVELGGVSAGQKVRAVVTDGWGNDVANPESVIGPGSSQQWLALPIPLPNELAPGEYGAFVFVDDQPIGSLAFGVTGVGSSAQLLPDAPANPQISSTVPPPGMGPAASQPTPTLPPA